MPYTRRPFEYEGEAENQIEQDLNEANTNFEMLADCFVDNDPATQKAKDSDKVDGYHASQTPSADTIPVAESTGKINLGWIPQGSGSNLDTDLLDGQHGSYYLDRANHTGTQPPSSINPQGSGSTLDADLLDGQHGDYYLNRANHTGTQPPNTINPQGHNSGLDADKLDGQEGSYYLDRTHHIGTQPPSTISPQGSGSGLDADKLDGQEGSYYLNRANHTGTQAPDTISPQGSGSGLDADKLDGYHASQTPTANTIPVAGSDGKIDEGWLPEDVTLDNLIVNNKIGIGITTPSESLEVNGNVIIAGGKYLGADLSNKQPSEIFGFFTDFTGYGRGGLPLIVPGAFNQLLFLPYKGGSITSDKTPAYGSLSQLVDGRGAPVYWNASDAPVTITFNLETAYSYMRQFIIYFYPNYAPSQFTVEFYDANDQLSLSDTQTNWPAEQGVYVLLTGTQAYGTKKIKIILQAPKPGFGYMHIFEVVWTNYELDPFPAYLNRGSGGTIYGKVGIGITAPTRMLHIKNATGRGEVVIHGQQTEEVGNAARLWFSLTWDSNIDEANQRGRQAYIEAYATDTWGKNVRLDFATSSTISEYPVPRMSITHTGNVGIGTTAPSSKLHCYGSFATRVHTVTSNTTLGADHHVVLVNASDGSRTITLPDATTCAGRQYIIKKIDSSSNTVTVSPQSGQTIDGQSSVNITAQYGIVRVVSDGSNWYTF